MHISIMHLEGREKMYRWTMLLSILSSVIAFSPGMACADGGNSPPPAGSGASSTDYGAYFVKDFGCSDAYADLSGPDKAVGNWCWTKGPMTVPFRAELTGKHDIFGGLSADYFLGINLHERTAKGQTGSLWDGFNPTFLVYLGYLPTFSASNASTGSSGSSGTGALDFGLGVAVPVPTNIDGKSAEALHFGAVLGFDETSSSNKFSYNGKPYISVLLGTTF